jgi:hypothetical protein
MAQDHGTPGENIVDVSAPFHIEDISAAGLADKHGVQADGSEGPDRAVDAAWDDLFGFFKKVVR